VQVGSSHHRPGAGRTEIPPTGLSNHPGLLSVLQREGKVSRQLQDRAYWYQAVLSRQQAVSEAVVQLLDRYFEGSAGSLVLNLVATGQVSGEELTAFKSSRPS
jgi:predicted transcriptional regulator